MRFVQMRACVSLECGRVLIGGHHWPNGNRWRQPIALIGRSVTHSIILNWNFGCCCCCCCCYFFIALVNIGSSSFCVSDLFFFFFLRSILNRWPICFYECALCSLRLNNGWRFLTAYGLHWYYFFFLNVLLLLPSLFLFFFLYICYHTRILCIHSTYDLST